MLRPSVRHPYKLVAVFRNNHLLRPPHQPSHHQSQRQGVVNPTKLFFSGYKASLQSSPASIFNKSVRRNPVQTPYQAIEDHVLLMAKTPREVTSTNHRGH